MGTKTALVRASGEGKSLRTTVPMSIVKQFELNEGDELEWVMRVRNNKLVIEIDANKNNMK